MRHCLLLCVFGITAPCFGDVLRVPADFATIQGCINAAVDGDECVVSPGDYFGGLDFAAKAITVRSIDPTDAAIVKATVISLYWGHDSVVKCVSGEGADTVLAGLSIASGSGSPCALRANMKCGGGMRIDGSSPTVSRCIFRDNTAHFGGGIYMSDASPTISDCIVVSNSAVLNGGGMYGVASSPSVTDSTFRGNLALGIIGAGGAVYGVDGRSARFEKCAFEGNSAEFGGGVYSWRLSDVLFTNCSFMDNTANKQGGAIYNNSSAASVVTSKLERNSSRELGGGGLYQFGGSLKVLDSVFRKNETGGRGGGLYSLVLDSLTVSGTTLAENVAGEDGGGMFNIRVSDSNVVDCKFSRNTARRGGGMYSDHSDANVKGCIFSDNNAVGPGGGMYNVSTNSELTACIFEKNTAGSFGGGMCNLTDSNPLLKNCTFRDNFAENGGGMSNDEGNRPTLIECLFEGNSASESGGAIHNWVVSSPVISGCVFKKNSAQREGGAVLSFYGHDASVTDSSFIGNSARWGGGFFDFGGRRRTLRDCIFVGNKADNSGGGLLHHRSRTLVVSNSVFLGNSATAGGGMSLSRSESPSVNSCTFADNVAEDGPSIAAFFAWAGGRSVVVANSVLSGSSNEIWLNDGSSAMLWHSNIQGGVPDGVIDGGGNLDVDPLFARWPDDGGDGWGDDPETSDVDESLNDDFGDLRLRASSPLIDAGDNSAVPDGVVVDLLGNDRFVDDPFAVDTGVGAGPVVDMGAYEYQPDCNGNGVGDDVDVLDGSSLDCNENGYPDECDADSDGDGVPDECDGCAGSDVGETVVIGECDTGVFNLSVGEGCLMSDAVVACFEDAWIPRSFVSCVSKVARGWKHDGLINRREFGRIVSCAGRRRGVMNREE